MSLSWSSHIGRGLREELKSIWVESRGGGEIVIAEVEENVSVEVDPASETDAEVVVTGVDEVVETDRAGRAWRGIGRGGPSLPA